MGSFKFASWVVLQCGSCFLRHPRKHSFYVEECPSVRPVHAGVYLGSGGVRSHKSFSSTAAKKPVVASNFACLSACVSCNTGMDRLLRGLEAMSSIPPEFVTRQNSGWAAELSSDQSCHRALSSGADTGVSKVFGRGWMYGIAAVPCPEVSVVISVNTFSSCSRLLCN